MSGVITETESPENLWEYGKWQVRGGIKVWVPDVVVMDPREWRDLEPEPAPAPAPRDDLNMVACHCGATVTEQCRTKNGIRTRTHPGRTIPRACSCGTVLEYKRSVCAECRRVRDLESKRTYHQRKRAETPAKPRPLPAACVRGHEYTPENTYRRPDGARGCKACNSQSVASYKARQREEDAA